MADLSIAKCSVCGVKGIHACMGNVIDVGTLNTSTVNFRRQEHAPSDFRYAVRPDGKLHLQGGYVWWEHHDSGTEWRDIPVVHLDNEGSVI